MCGITGLIRSKPLSSNDIDAIRRCNASMLHRGPDGAGEFEETSNNGSHLFMAMRRLSIIDPSHGWQPLKNEDETVAVIVNGEIYNHIELRTELEARGHSFRTHSDCEVLVHLYEELGLDFVHKLRGMFAFALWDERARRLVLGRDRMGEKPLYLYTDRDGVWFASELKVLLSSGRMPFSLDAPAIHSYLHYGWIPEPQTAVKDIHKLRAGHLLVIDVDPWSLHEHRYWCIENSPVVERSPVEVVREELETIGRLIVRSDVPIGVALSGGFDSSLAAALAARNNPSTVHAFTVGYEGSPGQDERALARTFAQDIGLQFHELELSASDMVDSFPRVAFERDDPICDIAGYGYHSLSRYAREIGCPVLLQGQGADELVWGYSWAMQAVTHSLRKFGNDPVKTWEAIVAQFPNGISRPQLVRFAYIIGGALAGWRQFSPGRRSARSQLVTYDLTDQFQIGAKAALSTYGPIFREQVVGSGHRPEEFFAYMRNGANIDIQIIALLCRGYLLENGLSQGDRLSMANSVELRLPLVDYRLAEILVGIQKHTPVYIERPKGLLIDAARELVPEYVMNRPKRGFTPPVSDWVMKLRKKYGKELINGSLVEAGILSAEAAQKMANFSSRFSVAYDMFQKYLVLEFWHRGMQSVAQFNAQDE